MVVGPTGVSVGTRLRLDADEKILLRAVEKVLTSARAWDLPAAQRREKANDRSKALAERFGIPSRYAGTICVDNDAAVKAAKEHLWRDRKQLKQAIRTVEQRTSLPSRQLACGCRKRGCKNCGKGYSTEAIRVAKRQRLDALRADLAQVEKKIKDKHFTVCLGGKRLAKTRHHLEEAGLTEAQWSEEWERRRSFFASCGNTGKPGGNPCLTLLRSEAGAHYLTVSVPRPVQRQLGVPARVRLRHPVPLHHHASEVQGRLEERLAVRVGVYRELNRKGREKTMLRLSWARPAVEPLSLQQARVGGLLAVDLNADHLACALLDQDGNPLGQPHRIDLGLKDPAGHKLPASLRDARLREAVSQIIRIAQASGVRTIAIEDLGFTGETTREKHGRNKTFRDTLSGFPTLQFRDRLAAMTATAGLTLVSVDPRYTSKVGGKAWQRLWRRPTSPTTQAGAPASQSFATRHEGAAVAIGRRALAHGLKAGDRPASKRPVYAPERRAAPHQRPVSTGSVLSRPGGDGSNVTRFRKEPGDAVWAPDASSRPSTAAALAGHEGVTSSSRPTDPAPIPKQNAATSEPTACGRGPGGPSGPGGHPSPLIGSAARSVPD